MVTLRLVSLLDVRRWSHSTCGKHTFDLASMQRWRWGESSPSSPAATTDACFATVWQAYSAGVGGKRPRHHLSRPAGTRQRRIESNVRCSCIFGVDSNNLCLRTYHACPRSPPQPQASCAAQSLLRMPVQEACSIAVRCGPSAGMVRIASSCTRTRNVCQICCSC